MAILALAARVVPGMMSTLPGIEDLDELQRAAVGDGECAFAGHGASELWMLLGMAQVWRGRKVLHGLARPAISRVPCPPRDQP